ncbi:hypothetical protein HYH03_013255 [Edaphochlamys debaryana]|uniref:V-type proton ATPase subunit a n=1 Tax=Edaphochlamys debaryana TaxID=47281 RepID=A0A835XTS1_9CHLO|nr:hypothetical protein HYH03_013255 [Edaphochlamys debaryana]|eukprot:KAG2488106.1 hypothetical protein HYH03_013255 [Edaphochlamys debaryana]
MAGRFLDLGNIELWRSEEMQLVQLMIPADTAHDTVEALGEIGLLQFKDLNVEKSAFQRTYANQVRRCDELARKLRFFKEQIEKAGVPMASRSLIDGSNVTMDELEGLLEQLEGELVEMNANHDRLQRAAAELAELSLLLDCAGKFFDSARRAASGAGTVVGGLGGAASGGGSAADVSAPLLGGGLGGGGLEASAGAYEPKIGRLGSIAGLIARERLAGFERLLFRATRGNNYFRFMQVGLVLDPATGEQVDKAVFVVFFAGERARVKIGKICEAFGANRYPLPEEPNRQRAMAAEVGGRLTEMRTTLEVGDLQRMRLLQRVAADIDAWATLVRREKAVYHTLNKCSVDVTKKVLVAEAWVPSSARPRVQEALRAVADSSNQVGTILQPMLTHENPPTYFRTNKFTACFQNIVDAYGIARYREVNPAVFTIATFPFLFAVMFGDLGHGILMSLFGAWLLINESKFLKQTLDDMFGMLFGGRYCIMLMGLFSIYMGVLYNEFFSMPMVIGGDSHFACFFNGTRDASGMDRRDCPHHGGELKPVDGAYPVGVDPIWHGGKMELPFLNSMKMKMSILLGVTHMNLGILMSVLNNNYFRDRLSTVCEFIPQMIFLNCLFGYLCALIVGKWVSGASTDLYHVMIYMFLSPGNVDKAGYLFPGQAPLQVVLLLVALVAVPWMLFPKPLILKKRAEAAARVRGEYHRMEDAETGGAGGSGARGGHAAAAAHGGGGGGHGDHGEVFEFGEVMVHQMIHTIEFVLGAVSNTASYLRLWALSLAHSQLSAVFYDRVLMASIQSTNPAAMVVGFFVFACATLGVLMVMESLSAFLHALRLHWVEFQNKFYRGDGYQFAPFSVHELKEEEVHR